MEQLRFGVCEAMNIKERLQQHAEKLNKGPSYPPAACQFLIMTALADVCLALAKAIDDKRAD